MSSHHYFWRAVLAICAVCIALVGLVAISAVSRQYTLPPLLKYVSADASTIFYIGSPETLVETLNSHTDPLFPNGINCKTDPDRYISGILSSVACGLSYVMGLNVFGDHDEVLTNDLYAACGTNESEISLLDGLRRRGIDMNDPIMISSRGPFLGGDFLVVFSVSNFDCFETAINEWRGGVEVKQMRLNFDQSVSPLVIPLDDKGDYIARGDTRRLIFGDTVSGLVIADESDTPASVYFINNDRAYNNSILNKGRIYTNNDLCGTRTLQHWVDLHNTDAMDSTFLYVTRADDPGVAPSYRLRGESGRMLANAADGLTLDREAKFQNITDRALLQASIEIDGRIIEIGIAGPSICYAILDERHVAIFSNLETLKSAVTNRRGGSTIGYQRSFQTGLRSIMRDSQESVSIWGFMRQPGLYVAHPIAIGLLASPEQLQLRIWTRFRVSESTFLSRFFNQAAEPLSNADESATPRFRFRISDEDVGAYLERFRELFPNAYTYLRKSLERGDEEGGRYKDILDIVRTTNDITEVGIELNQSGEVTPVPHVQLRISELAADSLIFRLQSQQRFERDSSIYLAALAAEKAEGKSVDVGAHRDYVSPDIVLKNVSRLLERGFLKIEEPWLFNRLATGEYQREDFDNSVYRGCFTPDQVGPSKWKMLASNDAVTQCPSKIRYAYIFPPVTNNDLRYRFNDLQETAEEFSSNFKLEDITDDESQLNQIKEGLKSNRFRVIAVYDSALLALIIATGQDTVKSALPLQRRATAYSLSRAIQSIYSDDEKLSIVIDPYWWSQELRTNPSESAREFGEKVFPEIADYSSAYIKIATSRRNGGTIVEFGLERF